MHPREVSNERLQRSKKQRGLMQRHHCKRPPSSRAKRVFLYTTLVSTEILAQHVYCIQPWVKRVFITNVKGTFFGMSESEEASKRPCIQPCFNLLCTIENSQCVSQTWMYKILNVFSKISSKILYTAML